MSNATSAPTGRQAHNLLVGKVIVVTAAAGTGIGASVARRCIEEGATVVISDIHERRLGAAVDALEAATGVRPGSRVCDVTNQQHVDALLQHALDLHGRLDVLINNAGLGGTSDLIDMTDDAWHRVIDVTLTSTMRCMRSALRIMRAQDTGGVIVNNASVLGWRAQRGQSHYAAAKAGVMALTRCAAVEAADYGVRINAVSPSLAMHKFLHKVTSPELLAQLEAKEAYGRAATTDEVANVMVFLASDLATYMTGEVVSVSNQRA
jgi:3-oxoacyl-[acyl-carrier protein] reductase